MHYLHLTAAIICGVACLYVIKSLPQGRMRREWYEEHNEHGIFNDSIADETAHARRGKWLAAGNAIMAVFNLAFFLYYL